MVHLREEFQIIENSSLFRNLDQKGTEEIINASFQKELLAGEYFFHEDDPAEFAYVLVEGKVKLIQVTLDGHQIILGYLVPGRVFGIIALLKKVTYPVSAQAVGGCRALVWDQSKLNQLMERYPRIALNSLRIMSGQIRVFQNRVRDLSTKRVETRIARTVLRLARQSGVKIEGGVLIDLPISRQDLAEMAGTTLYTASRVLSDWEKQDIVQSSRQQIVIRYPHGLVSIAEDLPESGDGDALTQAEDLCDI